MGKGDEMEYGKVSKNQGCLSHSGVSLDTDVVIIWSSSAISDVHTYMCVGKLPLVHTHTHTHTHTQTHLNRVDSKTV